jgi:hypothetical protein
MPEMAEELAIEQIKIASPNSVFRQWLVSIFFGIFLAALFSCGSYTWKTENHDYSSILKEGWTVMGFCLGFGFGWASIFESTKRMKKSARLMQQKSGVARTIAWDDEWLMLSSDISRTQIRWRAIDKLVNAKVGIHLFVGGKIHFGIHKNGLPKNFSADDLIKVCQNHLIPVI